MDLPTARRHIQRLKDEVDALTHHVPEHFCVVTLMEKELVRLNEHITNEVNRFLGVVDGPEAKIPVESELNMLLTWPQGFEMTLTDEPALDTFRKLNSELLVIRDLNQPLPLICKFTIRAMERLEEEIIRQQQSSGETPSESNGFNNAALEKSIKDAIKTAVRRSKQDATSNEVLQILSEKSGIVIDEYVKSTARKRFFEATFVEYPAPGKLVHCCSFLELIIPSHWSFLNRWFS